MLELPRPISSGVFLLLYSRIPPRLTVYLPRRLPLRLPLLRFLLLLLIVVLVKVDTELSLFDLSTGGVGRSGPSPLSPEVPEAPQSVTGRTYDFFHAFSVSFVEFNFIRLVLSRHKIPPVICVRSRSFCGFDPIQ